MERFEIPAAVCGDCELVYKTVGERKIALSFRPPLEKKYDRAPVYFIISGGGWHEESRDSMSGFSARSTDALRHEGWAMVSIDYRVSPADSVSMTDIVSDCMDAARYIAHFASTLGVNSRRILVSGHSAGAHLALMMALAPHGGFCADSPFDPVADDFGIIGAAPLSAPTIMYHDAMGHLPLAGFEPAPFESKPETPEQLLERHRTSPIDYVTPLSVPLLLVAGTHDNLVYVENSTRLADACHAVGAPCELFLSHFGGHCFEPMVEGKAAYPDFNDVQEAIITFARKTLAALL